MEKVAVTVLNHLRTIVSPLVPDFVRQRVRARRQRRRAARGYHEIAIDEAEEYGLVRAAST